MASNSKDKRKGFDAYTKKHKISKNSTKNKSDFDAVQLVMKRYGFAKSGRQSTCYWLEDSATDDEGSQDWSYIWEKQRKAWLGWYKKPSRDDFQANYKSPATTGRIESTIQKFQRLDIGWNALPTQEDDKGKAKIMSVLLSNYFTRGNVKQKIVAAVKEAMIHGTSHIRILPVKIKREVKPYKTSISEEDYKKGNYFEEAKEEIVYNDINLYVPPIQDLYIDPQARCLEGIDYAARYIIDRRIMTVDEVKETYSSNPLSKNLDKIKGKSFYKGDQYEFWKPPGDISAHDGCEVLIYESVPDDRYIVVVNDIVVLDSPLPWNHKGYSYVKIDCVPVENQYYGIGVADRLRNVQAHEEMLMNMALDKFIQSLSYRMLIANDVFGQASRGLARADSALIPIDNTDGQPLSSKIFQLQHPGVGFDFYNLFELMGRDETMFTQIDPSQMALMERGATTATETMINKEQMEVQINALVDNLATGGLLHLGNKLANLIRQEYSRPKIEEIDKQEGKTELREKWRKIRLDGLQVVEEDDDVRIEQLEDDYSFFEVKGEYLNTKAELDLQIKPETLQVMSKGLEMQKMQEAFAQLMPLAIDPNNRQARMQHPMPLVDALRLVRKYVEVMGYGEDILINPEENYEEDYDRAIEDIAEILAGENKSGVPGESTVHLNVQNKTMLELKAQYEEMIEQAESSRQPMGRTPRGEVILSDPPQQLIKQIEELEGAIERLQAHIMEDSMSEDLVAEMGMQPPQQQAPQQPGGKVPMTNQAQPPQVPGGNNNPAVMGNVPQPQGASQQDIMGSGFGGQV